MLGESKQTFFTVKDLAPAEFIQAFGQYLKKNNLVERPTWIDQVKLSTRNIHFKLRKRSRPNRRRLDLFQSCIIGQKNIYQTKSWS